MIRTQVIEQQLRQGRLDAKTLDSLFCRRIEEGANCPPFVSRAILSTVKEVFGIDPHHTHADLGVGQVKFLAVAADEPSGKPLQQCQKATVLLTLDAGDDDLQVRLHQGIEGLRRSRILRLCTQAREQGALLSYEDLAYRLLNCSERTVVRDVEHMRRQGLVVPSRGQQQDIGPGQTHRVQAVQLYLQGHEPQDIARRLYHSLRAIENYLNAFGRVVFLSGRGCDDLEIAFLLRCSTALVQTYQRLAEKITDRPSAQRRLQEILTRVENSHLSKEKKGFRT